MIGRVTTRWTEPRVMFVVSLVASLIGIANVACLAWDEQSLLTVVFGLFLVLCIVQTTYWARRL